MVLAAAKPRAVVAAFGALLDARASVHRELPAPVLAHRRLLVVIRLEAAVTGEPFTKAFVGPVRLQATPGSRPLRSN